ncbi:hypothetical protein BLD25_04755 [Candidatus Gracilibacteria bacterium GN02-872]|nr:hypothetical protein BLD25_04755 [Candidatus Gracilibacteria bacterium GN02-872]RKW20257.1 MAG: hypothetical protein D8B46_09910 [Candidatus Gracilibacteria bacterium]
MSQVNMNDKQVDSLVLEKLSLHQDGIIVDKEFFLDLLKHSLSLNVTEKQRVIDSVPTLTQFQFDELTKVFLEERQKFRDLAKEHTDDIKKLVEKQKNEWIELGELYVIADKSEQMAKDDQAKIDDIKSQLGL